MSDRRRDKKSRHSARRGGDYSSSDESDGSSMQGGRGSRRRDTLDIPHGPPRRRDSDWMFPRTRDTGHSSAEISTISMSSAAYPFDPRSVTSASSVSRDRESSPPRPTTRRGGRHEPAQFSIDSTPSSRSTDEEFDASTLSYVPSRTVTSTRRAASAVPSGFSESTFQNLPSDSDGEGDRRDGRGSGGRHTATSTREKGRVRRHSPVTSDRSPCSPSERMPPQTSPPRSFAERHTDRHDPPSPATAWWLQGKSRDRERERRRGCQSYGSARTDD